MKKYTFPEFRCSSCQYYQTVGDFPWEVNCCSGFNRKKSRRYRSSDPKIKAPRWCPRRISPPLCRIYGFTDENSKWMELMQQYEFGRKDIPISPLPYHYKLRTEVSLGLTARQFFIAAQNDYLENILPPGAEVQTGEIIEIDDGLQPYCFYVNSGAVVPLRYFKMRNRRKESDPK